VPEEPLHELGVDAAAQEQGGADVPEIVEAYLRKTSLPQERFKRPFYEILGVEKRYCGFYLPSVALALR